jgi:hypothetical protein
VGRASKPAHLSSTRNLFREVRDTTADMGSAAGHSPRRTPQSSTSGRRSYRPVVRGRCAVTFRGGSRATSSVPAISHRRGIAARVSPRDRRRGDCPRGQ